MKNKQTIFVDMKKISVSLYLFHCEPLMHYRPWQTLWKHGFIAYAFCEVQGTTKTATFTLDTKLQRITICHATLPSRRMLLTSFGKGRQWSTNTEYLLLPLTVAVACFCLQLLYNIHDNNNSQHQPSKLPQQWNWRLCSYNAVSTGNWILIFQGNMMSTSLTVGMPKNKFHLTLYNISTLADEDTTLPKNGGIHLSTDATPYCRWLESSSISLVSVYNVHKYNHGQHKLQLLNKPCTCWKYSHNMMELGLNYRQLSSNTVFNSCK